MYTFDEEVENFPFIRLDYFLVIVAAVVAVDDSAAAVASKRLGRAHWVRCCRCFHVVLRLTTPCALHGTWESPRKWAYPTTYES